MRGDIRLILVEEHLQKFLLELKGETSIRAIFQAGVIAGLQMSVDETKRITGKEAYR